MGHPIFLSVVFVPIFLAGLRFTSPLVLPALEPAAPPGKQFFKEERGTLAVNQPAYTFLRYQRNYTLGSATDEIVWNTIKSVIEKVRVVTGDNTISRLVTLNGRPIRKFADLPNRFIALNAIEHFYYPFFGDGYEHDLTGLTDRPVRLFDRSGGSARPRVLEIHSFLSEEECDIIVGLAKARGLAASGLVLTREQKMEDFKNTRTSTGVFIDYWSDPVLDRLAWRAYNITTVPAHHSEDLQVIHYDPEQHYHAHWDHIGDETKDSKSWWKGVKDGHPEDNRYLTLLLYLNDVEKGGETVFPRTNEQWSAVTHGYDQRLCVETFPALRVKPRKGNAVLFYNVPETGQSIGLRDEYSLHGGCDPLIGEKWAANFWVHLWEWRNLPANQRAYLSLGHSHDHDDV